MSSDPGVGEAPSFALRRLGRVGTYEVLESDLDALDAATRRESLALMVTSLCTGIAVPSAITFVTLLGSVPEHPATWFYVALGLDAAVTLASGLVAGGAFLAWRIESRERPAVLARIKSTYRVVG